MATVNHDLVITRVSYRKDGTFGVAEWKGLPFCVTLERPWAINQRGISCIPSDSYKVLRCNNSPDYGYKDSPKFGDTFQVFGVPGRGNILFHKGNIDDDTHGCILLGESFDPIKGKAGILSSAHAFNEFMALTAGINEFRLLLREV